jgi:bifunctional DNase/RNase
MTAANMIPIKKIYLNSEPGSGNMVILKETEEAERYFMMFVGDAEFAAISKEKGLIQTSRPLTHDLYLSILKKVQVSFLRVEIREMRGETFYAQVFFSLHDEEQSVDSRPSDGVALALNRKIPILVNQALFRRKLSKEEVEEYQGIIKTVKF